MEALSYAIISFIIFICGCLFGRWVGKAEWPAHANCDYCEKHHEDVCWSMDEIYNCDE